MRLNNTKIAAMQKGLEESELCPPRYELFLFGSRVDDNKSGGDIDLLLVVDESVLDHLNQIKYKLITALKKYIDDERIDLVLLGKKSLADKLSNDPFYSSIKDSLIMLFFKDN